ncbi:MAG: hypothetical protein ACREDD_11620 [Methylocella sp.]
MTLPSLRRMTQIAVGLLLVIVIRMLGEVLRLHYVFGDRLINAQSNVSRPVRSLRRSIVLPRRQYETWGSKTRQDG